MTSPDELAWHHAIETENFDLSKKIEDESTPSDASDASNRPKISSATKEQAAILGSAAYWGVDYGSLPNNEP